MENILPLGFIVGLFIFIVRRQHKHILKKLDLDTLLKNEEKSLSQNQYRFFLEEKITALEDIQRNKSRKNVKEDKALFEVINRFKEEQSKIS